MILLLTDWLSCSTNTPQYGCDAILMEFTKVNDNDVTKFVISNLADIQVG